jgi:DNA-binding CsgD family transcriptional regulator
VPEHVRQLLAPVRGIDRDQRQPGQPGGELEQHPVRAVPGKTTLLRAGCRSPGARVLTARGLALEQGFPYGIVRQLLEEVRGEDGLMDGAAVLTGPDALTAGERRVAALAADGLSNRQIAEHLFVTQATVETHLRHAFRKLDITSRAELTLDRS